MSGRSPERSSSPPTARTLREVATYRGLVFGDEQLDRAVDAYAAFWPKLERLRAIELRYAPPTITPADATAWIERGGGSSE